MFRRPFATQDAYSAGITHSALKHAVAKGVLQRVERNIYLRGKEPPTALERAIATVIAVDGIASGSLAGILHQLDSVFLEGKVATIPRIRNTRLPNVRRADIPTNRIIKVQSVRCTDGLQTLIDLAAQLDDLRWEQALESALRKRLLRVDDLVGLGKVRGADRIRRILASRPIGAPPTESLLETHMVQLIRREPRLHTPARQVEVFNRWGNFVARVDLAWPEYGIFLELDGQHHKDQPLYDANRQTAVVAATGWLPGRFTWHEVVNAPKPTLRRLMELFSQAAAHGASSTGTK